MVDNNSATYDGAGIFDSSTTAGTVAIGKSQIIMNTAGNVGGGIYASVQPALSGSQVIQNHALACKNVSIITPPVCK